MKEIVKFNNNRVIHYYKFADLIPELRAFLMYLWGNPFVTNPERDVIAHQFATLSPDLIEDFEGNLRLCRFFEPTKVNVSFGGINWQEVPANCWVMANGVNSNGKVNDITYEFYELTEVLP